MNALFGSCQCLVCGIASFNFPFFNHLLIWCKWESWRGSTGRDRGGKGGGGGGRRGGRSNHSIHKVPTVLVCLYLSYTLQERDKITYTLSKAHCLGPRPPRKHIDISTTCTSCNIVESVERMPSLMRLSHVLSPPTALRFLISDRLICIFAWRCIHLRNTNSRFYTVLRWLTESTCLVLHIAHGKCSGSGIKIGMHTIFGVECHNGTTCIP